MSATAKHTKARINFRSKSFWLISIFILYSLFGWVVVPMILDAQLKSILKSTAKWDTQIEEILFNPYALSVELKRTDIVETSNNPVVRFERLYINFNLLKTLGGDISFDEITLEKPQVHMDLDQQGTTNFQRAFTSDTADETGKEEVSPDEAGDPLALFFNTIAITEGAVYFTDNSTGAVHEIALMPLSLSLEEFSTHHNEGGEYALDISLGKEQSLKWQGQIGIAPFQSKGRLVLNNIDSGTFWHYVKDASPYWLNQAKVSVSGDYLLESTADGLQVVIEKTELQLDEVILSESEASEQWLHLKQLKVAPLKFDLHAAALDLGQISLEDLTLDIQRAKDETLNILRPLSAKEPAEANELTEVNAPQQETATLSDAEITEQLSSEAETSGASSSFQWQLSEISLNNGAVRWSDEAISTPARLNIEELVIETGAINQDLSKAFPFAISFLLKQADVPSQGSEEVQTEDRKIRLKGELSPLPFKLRGEAELPGIDLKLVQNYLNDLTNILIENGSVSLQADYDLVLEEQLSGTIKSNLRIDQLALKDTLLNKSLGGFQLLELGPLQIQLPENKTTAPSIRLDNILLDQFYADVLLSESGEMNLSHLSKSPPNELADSDTAASAETIKQQNQLPPPSEAETSSAKVDFVLNTFSLNKARLSYTDASLKPAFSARISDLSGSIKGISSSADAKSTVSFTGKLDSQSKLALNGTLNPLSETPESHIFLKLENFDLTTASPYSAKYAGYLIDKGKLGLDLDYLIKGSKIRARNEVILKQFEFGKSVKSKQATSLPLPLAIGILKDRKGVIDLDLPISGDLNDPSFQIGSVLLNTFVNVITKVVTSPFSILGGLIEGGDKLSDVAFQANTSELDAEQIQSVLKLTSALKERPKLSLEIRGVADANIDKVDEQARTAAELIKLAKERAQTLSKIVIEQGDIDSARVFIQEPEIIALKETSSQSASNAAVGSASNTVTTKFTLGVR